MPYDAVGESDSGRRSSAERRWDLVGGRLVDRCFRTRIVQAGCFLASESSIHDAIIQDWGADGGLVIRLSPNLVIVCN